MDIKTFKEQVKKSFDNWQNSDNLEHLKDINRLLIRHEIDEVLEQQQNNTMVHYQGRNIEILDTADIDGREGW